MYKNVLLASLCGLCLTCQTVSADDPDVQATLQEMRDLLEQQQKQLDEQSRELAAQRLLIKKLLTIHGVGGCILLRSLVNDILTRMLELYPFLHSA